MTKFNKPIKIAVTLLIVSLVFGCGYAFAKIGNPLELLKRSGSSNTSSKKTIAVPVKIEQEKPKYSVIIVKNGSEFNFSVEVKNVSITPFMTGLAFTDCKWLDNKGNEYGGSMHSSSPIRFSKGLFPGENIKTNFNVGSIALSGGGGFVQGRSDDEWINTPKCQYDNSGKYICASVEGLKLKECTVYTSTTEKIDVGRPLDRLSPMVVNFPR